MRDRHLDLEAARCQETDPNTLGATAWIVLIMLVVVVVLYALGSWR